jgi:RimJ/RimL family protein N-acetyltransferase
MSPENVVLRKPLESDLEIFFRNQADKEATYMAAFTSKDTGDREAYISKWKRLLQDPAVHMQTIMFGDEVAGTVVKFEREGKAEITYALGKEFWGRGITTKALQAFVLLEHTRPIFGSAAYDNIASMRVMEKSGFVRIGTDRGFANARGMEIEEVIFRLD